MTAWRRLAVPALLVAAPVIFFSDVCLRGQAFLLRDLFSWFYPWRDLARQAFASGEFPLWNPWSYMGTPFLANMQSGLLYPINAVFWILPFPGAMRIFVVLQFAAAALLMHALLRALGCRAAASVTGAVAWAFGGWMLVHIEFPNKLSAAAWLPLLALGIVRWLEGARRRGLLMGSAAVALSLAAGYPQTTATVCLGAAVPWGCALLSRPRDSSWGRALPWRAASLPAMTLLGGLIAGAQLLPFAQAAAGSERAGARAVSDVLQRSLEPGHMLGLLLPHLFGVPGYQRYWGGHLLQFWLGHFYVGLPVLALALLSPAALRAPAARRAPGAPGDARFPLRRWAIASGLSMLALSALLCLGEATPLAPLLVRLVPGLAYFRWFSTTSLLLAFSLCWLAALELEWLLARAEGDPEFARRLARAAVGLAAIPAAVAIVSVAAPPSFLALVRWSVAPVMLPDQAPFLTRHIDLVRGDAVRAALIAAALASLLLAAARGRLSWERAAWGIPVLVFLDLMGGASGVNHAGDPAIYTTPPATLEQVRSRMAPLARLYVTQDTLEKDLQLYGEEQEGYYRWASEIFLFNLNLPWRLFSASDGDPMRPARTAAWHRDVEENADQDRRRRLLALAGVSHVLRGSPGEPTEMIEVPGTLPRAWVVPGAVRVTPAEAFSRIGSPAWDPAREALVEDDAPSSLRPPGLPVPHRVTAVRHTFNSVTVEVEADAPGYLVLGEMMAPGWKATLDGAPAPVFTADYLYRAVEIPAGRHTVAMRYRPAGVMWGAVVSAAGLGILGVLAWGEGRVSRRSGPTPRRGGARRGTGPAPPRTAPTP